MDIKTLAPWLLAAGGGAGVIFAFWNQVKSFWTSLSSMVMVKATVDLDIFGPTVTWLEKHGTRIKLAPHKYYSFRQHVRPLGRVRKILFRAFHGMSHVYFLKGRPIWMREGVSKQGADFAEFSFIRGTVDWPKIMKEALDDEDAWLSNASKSLGGRYHVKHVFGESLGRARAWKRGGDDDGKSPGTPIYATGPNANHIDRFAGFLPLQWSWNEFGVPHTSSMSSMALDEILHSVVKEVKFWYDSRGWFRDRSIPWRCGLLFHGEPGTGKTSLARALAEDLDLPVFVFDLASMTNAEFIEEWKSALSEAPCMVLLEDIDGVFHGRRNIAVKDGDGGLTFDCLLNSLDGIERAEGVLLVVTTNNLEHVDPALARLPQEDSDEMPSRPGRIDRMVEFKRLDADGRLKVALRIVRDPEDARRLVGLGANDTGAQFQLRCIRVARRKFFAGEIKPVTDDRPACCREQDEGVFDAVIEAEA